MFRPRKANPNQVFHVSDNVSTVGFYNDIWDNPGTIVYGKNNRIIEVEDLLLTDIANMEYLPLPDSPLIGTGKMIDIPFNGAAPDVGLLIK